VLFVLLFPVLAPEIVACLVTCAKVSEESPCCLLNILYCIFPISSSTVSDDGYDRPSKKDLLIGKCKDKKDSKKDSGYAALERESSPEEDPEMMLVPFE
jgi:hypothetical protein